MSNTENKIAYVRQQDSEGHRVSTGGTTVAYRADAVGVLRVAGTVCREKENFCRKTGRGIALERLEDPDFFIEYDIVGELRRSFQNLTRDISSSLRDSSDPHGESGNNIPQKLKKGLDDLFDGALLVDNLKPAMLHATAVQLFHKRGITKLPGFQPVTVKARKAVVEVHNKEEV